ncbi:zinc ribbon domain-containing protein [Thermoflexus sp.]|uniref:zinc ribbon domain-containing protein n=1 Tax=Thermoflexus sp. TaxID=1969742 RepID=UPI0035E40B89
MKKIRHALMGGLLLVGGGALALYFVAGGGNVGLLVGGILLLSLALNFWLLPAAFRGWLYGWIPGLQRVSLPTPPPLSAPSITARVQDEVEKAAQGIAQTLEGSPPAIPAVGARTAFRCPHCGQRLDPRETRCEGCGQLVRFRCPHCGRDVEPSWLRCPACGGALPAAWEAERRVR